MPESTELQDHLSLRVWWFFKKFMLWQEQEILSHWRNTLGVSVIHKKGPLYLLLNGNLPVHFLGDRGPDDLTGIKLGVHTSQDELPTVLMGWLAGKKWKWAWASITQMSEAFLSCLSFSHLPSDTEVPQNVGVLFFEMLCSFHLAQGTMERKFSEKHPKYQSIGNTDYVCKEEDRIGNQAPENNESTLEKPSLGQSENKKEPLWEDLEWGLTELSSGLWWGHSCHGQVGN